MFLTSIALENDVFISMSLFTHRIEQLQAVQINDWKKKVFTQDQLLGKYCRSGNISEILILANFVRRTYLRIQESSENYYYNSATKENMKIREF